MLQILRQSNPDVPRRVGEQPKGAIETARMRIADLRGRGVYSGYPNASRSIFIHIPKTAGTSVARALNVEPDSPTPYYQYLRASPSKFRKFFKFAFVRNPWDRLGSAFFYLKREGGNLAAESENFRIWWETNFVPYKDLEDLVCNWLTPGNARTDVHFAPQSCFICDPSGRVMVDFVGRFEAIDRDFEFIARRLGTDVRLPVTNQSGHQSYQQYFTPRMNVLIQEVYAGDCRIFGYANPFVGS